VTRPLKQGGHAAEQKDQSDLLRIVNRIKGNTRRSKEVNEKMLHHGQRLLKLFIDDTTCGTKEEKEKPSGARLVHEGDVWHLMIRPGIAGCGADYPNMCKTANVDNVTCTDCLRVP
jgi:hypothetical protein